VGEHNHSFDGSGFVNSSKEINRYGTSRVDAKGENEEGRRLNDDDEGMMDVNRGALKER
jgi:hypothetical protein